MTENLSDSIPGNSSWNVGSAAKQGKAALRQGVEAAHKGVEAAREGLGQAQDYVNDGVDLLNDAANSLSEFVSRQPLVAVAGAFLIGYMAARLLRKASS
jgi:hypothetical protein